MLCICYAYAMQPWHYERQSFVSSTRAHVRNDGSIMRHPMGIFKSVRAREHPLQYRG